jgi:hypothetical protein
MVFILAATSALAADTVAVRYDERDTTVRSSWKDDWNRDWISYKGCELNLSVFGTGTVGEETLRHPSSRRVERDGRLGMGVALSYFFCRYVGVEGYAYSESTAGAFIDNAGGDLVLRLPIGDTGLAPYIFGGAARQIDPLYQWTFDGGAGLEWRFAPHVGVFIDGRYVFADKTKDFGMGRFGLKFGF